MFFFKLFFFCCLGVGRITGVSMISEGYLGIKKFISFKVSVWVFFFIFRLFNILLFDDRTHLV